MKIILLCWRDTTHPQGGGSERYLERVGEYLAAQGHEVIFHSARYPGSPSSSQRHGVQYLRSGGKFTTYISTACQLLWGKLRHADAIIDTQNGIPFFATLFSRAPVILLVHHCHRLQWPVAGKLIAKIGWLIESRIAPWVYADHPVVTVSVPSKEELEEVGYAPENITIIHNGIDPLPPSVPALPQDQRPHLITLSRLVPHKHIEDAIAVMCKQPTAILDIVGSGWWEDNLRAYAQSLNVYDRVVFHGHVSEERKHALLERADLHLMPSRKEGWGIAVVEAAQHGVPTIGYSSSGGLRDSIDHGKSGMLVDTSEQMATMVGDLLRDPTQIARLGDYARHKVQGYSWDETGRAFLDLINRQVAMDRAPTPLMSQIRRMLKPSVKSRR
ncbi:glycosyltransferase family 4 protein [Corynebacterium sp. ES2730-CONJ]|uniref:glycosyltransferase family 4 protein n=1 Tax=Corynebacterium sp. ES2730-CONJ TaxID=2973941 RepID=UPI00216B1D2E|nr:glycosyltransferase family 4 protein [Corynebacterium sp. ES2730-CONJ]MCS4532141.1 glycosyltransferase family 4 protein [Corynebacterium sp. ES2730-CONJ]